MRKPFLAIVAILLAAPLLAQQKNFKKNTAYFEAGGNSLGLGIGYERQMGKKTGLGLHLGISLGGNKPGIVTGTKYLVGLGNHKSFLETGLGVTLVDREYIGAKRNNQTNYNPYTPVFIPSVGYRHHTRYGLMWRVNYTPFISKYDSPAHYVGLSVGYRF